MDDEEVERQKIIFRLARERDRILWLLAGAKVSHETWRRRNMIVEHARRDDIFLDYK